MANELKKLVREAFNIAYTNHKTNKINEDSASMGASLEVSGQKQIADDILKTLINSTVGSGSLFWSPQGGSMGGKKINVNQLNYIVEKLVELYKQTKDNKYKMIIAYIYSPFAETGTFKRPDGTTARTIKSKPLYDFMLRKFQYSTELERLMEEDPEIFKEMISDVWNWMFVDGKIKPAKGEYKGQIMQTFDRMVAEYIPNESSNFGALINKYFENQIKNSTRREASVEFKTASMDAPTSSGRSHDFGDEIKDSPETVSATGEEDEENEFANLVTSAEGGPAEDSNSLEFKDYNTAIRQIIDTARLTDAASEAALTVFEETMLNYLDYDEIAEKYPQLFPKDENGILKKKPGNVLRDLIVQSPKSKFNQILIKFEAEYKIPSIVNALFRIVSKRADSEVEEVSKSNKNSYPSTIKYIINTSKSENITDIKSLLAFEGFFLDGLSFKEIVDENPGSFKDDNEVKKVLDKLLEKNIKFIEIVKNASEQFSLNSNLIDAYKKLAKKQSGETTGSQWISKSGKEMRAAQATKAPENDYEEEISEKFVVENLEKIMERVYIRLKKIL